MSEDECGAVQEQHRFNQSALERYLEVRLPGFPSNASGALTVSQYRSGLSNPTFYMQKGPKQYVLRKKPPGLLQVGAHQIGREYRVQKALSSAGFPVPKPLLHCQDVTVIGTEFYIMEHVKGRMFRDVALTGFSPVERCALYVAVIETLARLHALNVNELDLQGFGGGSGFCKREIAMIKIVTPRMASKVIDCAIHACGGAGICQDFPLALMDSLVRRPCLADGPDKVHLSTVAKMELRDQAKQLTAKM